MLRNWTLYEFRRSAAVVFVAVLLFLAGSGVHSVYRSQRLFDAHLLVAICLASIPMEASLRSGVLRVRGYPVLFANSKTLVPRMMAFALFPASLHLISMVSRGAAPGPWDWVACAGPSLAVLFISFALHLVLGAGISFVASILLWSNAALRPVDLETAFSAMAGLGLAILGSMVLLCVFPRNPYSRASIKES